MIFFQRKAYRLVKTYYIQGGWRGWKDIRDTRQLIHKGGKPKR